MKKRILIAIIPMLSCFSSYSAPARPKAKIEAMMNSLIQLTSKCLDYKMENEIFRETLSDIYALLHSSDYQSEDKEEVLRKVKIILGILMGDVDSESQAQ